MKLTRNKSMMTTTNIIWTELAEIDANMGFAQMLNNEKAEVVDTKFGKSPVGSFLSCQTSFTESNFSAEADLPYLPVYKLTF